MALTKRRQSRGVRKSRRVKTSKKSRRSGKGRKSMRRVRNSRRMKRGGGFAGNKADCEKGIKQELKSDPNWSWDKETPDCEYNDFHAQCHPDCKY
jgi:hypothetical protein